MSTLHVTTALSLLSIACIQDARPGAGRAVCGPSTEELPAVAGVWYLVGSTLPDPDGAVPATWRGTVLLRPDGAVDVGLRSSDGSGPDVSVASYCTGGAALEMRLGDDVFRGAFDDEAALMVLSSPSGRASVLLSRIGRDAVDGTYTVVATRSAGRHALLDTVASRITFDQIDGAACVVGLEASRSAYGGSLAAPIAAGGPRPCLATDASGQLVLKLSSASGKQVTWRGVSAPKGDVLILTEDAADGAPAYGTIVLVRETPLTDADMEGIWAIAAQEVTETDAQAPREAAGELWLDAEGDVIYGRLVVEGASSEVLGAWYRAQENGSFSMSLLTGGEVRQLRGVANTEQDLIAAFAVSGASNSATEYPLKPGFGSFVWLMKIGDLPGKAP